MQNSKRNKQPPIDKVTKRTLKFTYFGILPDLNSANEVLGAPGRYNSGKYQDWKNEVDERVRFRAAFQLKGKPRIDGPCAFIFRWYSPDRRKDQDNVEYAKKFIMDGLVKAKILPNDNWRYQTYGTIHLHGIDPDNPRVEVTILQNQKIQL